MNENEINSRIGIFFKNQIVGNICELEKTICVDN